MSDLTFVAPIRLLILDVDGTLVGSNLQTTPRVRQALCAARERGIYVSLCTGRPEISTRAFIEDLCLPGFHIVDSGATIVDVLAGVTLYRQPLDKTLAHQLLDYARKAHISLEAYTHDGYFIEAENELTRIHSRLQRITATVTDLAQVIDAYDVTKLEAAAIDSAEVAHVQVMLDHFADRIDYGWASAPGVTARFVNMLTRGVSKGDAVRRLAAHLGIAIEQTLGVGDSENDESLLRAVGLSVAMGNSSEELKRIARWITADVEEDGLAIAIDRFILSNGR